MPSFELAEQMHAHRFQLHHLDELVRITEQALTCFRL